MRDFSATISTSALNSSPLFISKGYAHPVSRLCLIIVPSIVNVLFRVGIKGSRSLASHFHSTSFFYTFYPSHHEVSLSDLRDFHCFGAFHPRLSADYGLRRRSR